MLLVYIKKIQDNSMLALKLIHENSRVHILLNNKTSELPAISMCSGHSVHHQLAALQSNATLINSLLKLKCCPVISPGVTYCQHRMSYLSCSPVYRGRDFCAGQTTSGFLQTDAGPRVQQGYWKGGC